MLNGDRICQYEMHHESLTVHEGLEERVEQEIRAIGARITLRNGPRPSDGELWRFAWRIYPERYPHEIDDALLAQLRAYYNGGRRVHEDTPAQKWQLIGSCATPSDTSGRRGRVLAAIATVHNMPPGTEIGLLRAAQEADSRDWDTLVRAYLAAYAAMLNEAAAPVDKLALPFADGAEQ
jgi:hypothetical protein